MPPNNGGGPYAGGFGYAPTPFTVTVGNAGGPLAGEPVQIRFVNCAGWTSCALTPVPAGLIAPNKWGAITNNNLTAWVGGWGVTFAPNLTPDKATGLGSWTPEMFANALRTGKHRGEANGRPILPPMPWPMYKDLTDGDLRAMFAYLQSLPPINNMAPPPLSPDKIPR